MPWSARKDTARRWNARVARASSTTIGERGGDLVARLAVGREPSNLPGRHPKPD
jgi:hypothetical protein